MNEDYSKKCIRIFIRMKTYSNNAQLWWETQFKYDFLREEEALEQKLYYYYQFGLKYKHQKSKITILGTIFQNCTKVSILFVKTTVEEEKKQKWRSPPFESITRNPRSNLKIASAGNPNLWVYCLDGASVESFLQKSCIRNRKIDVDSVGIIEKDAAKLDGRKPWRVHEDEIPNPAGNRGWHASESVKYALFSQ